MGGCCGKGKKKDGHDPRSSGPIKNRSCTDIFCCLLFFVFIIGFSVVGLFAWLNGDPIILLHPTDSQGRLCGRNYGDLDLSDKPYLFFFDLTECANPSSYLQFQCKTTQICVSSCPDTTWTYYQDHLSIFTSTQATNELKAGSVNWTNYYCVYNYDAQAEYEKGTNGADDLRNIIETKRCAAYTMKSDPILNRCIPSVASDAVSFATSTGVQIVDSNNQAVTGENLNKGSDIVRLYLDAQTIATKVLADFASSWYWILGGIGLAAVISFIWIVIMRWIAGIMVWITIFALFGVLIFGMYYTGTEWQRLQNVDGADRSLVSVGFTTNLSQYLALQETWLAFFIILCVFTLILLLIILFLRKRIMIAIEIIKAASRAVSNMTSTLFYPLITFVLILIVVTFWGATELFLASSGDPVYKVLVTESTSAAINENNTVCDIGNWSQITHTYYNDSTAKCIFVEYGGESVFHQNTFWLQIGIIFIFFWIVNWVIALGQCSLAGAFASYYWAFDKSKDVPGLPLFSAFGRSLRYHTGSLAFGSFIIALVQIIRVFLEYLDHKLKGAENKCAKFCLCICKCCCWCLENVLKFLNKNAYIMVAIYGKNFCASAKKAFKLLIRNILRVIVVDKVTDFLLFIGKLVVTAGLVALSWAFFGNKISFASSVVPTLNYYWMPIIVIGIAAYLVASGFFNTYSMAVDTTFLCFLEDLERNDGSEENPYYMSKGLMKVLGKKNKTPKDKKKKEKKK